MRPRRYRAAWRERDGRVIIRRYSDKERRDHNVFMAIAAGLQIVPAAEADAITRRRTNRGT